jgi:hypothetical protein
MIDSLPDEIIYEIIKHLDITPIELYSLRMINKKIYHMITSLNNHTFHPIFLLGKMYYDLCRTNLSVKSFDWYLRNGVQLTIPQMNLFVKYNRVDILKRGFHHKQFLDTLFNRFHIQYEKEDLFTMTSSENPITIAAMYGRIDIIHLLINSSIYGNPFRKNMCFLLDTAIKYNQKNVIKYLLINQYSEVNKNNDFQLKSHKIIHRIPDCEDLFFYCIETKKLVLTNSILSGTITMNYYDFFVYCLKKRLLTKNGHSQFIIQTIQEERIKFLDHLLQIYDVDNELFTEYLRAKKRFSNKFLLHIINNYLYKIKRSINLIQVCILNGLSNEIIFKLIDLKFKYGYEEIHWVVGQQNLDLLKYLVNHMEE